MSGWKRLFASMRHIIRIFVLVLVIVTTLVFEVGRTLVFVRLSILKACQQCYLGAGWVGLWTHILIPPQCLVDIARRKLV